MLLHPPTPSSWSPLINALQSLSGIEVFTTQRGLVFAVPAEELQPHQRTTGTEMPAAPVAMVSDLRGGGGGVEMDGAAVIIRRSE
ncbi:unnamed protein product [Pleuronectes platessa]|uniref:Uncharacterized protein n=1 Tax=Pleuronectes platessa TaxID=8262 RepID=A0A9N7V7J5_PLEPL|nr:unnamed protein product [Pleuronectes platessa]